MNKYLLLFFLGLTFGADAMQGPASSSSSAPVPSSSTPSTDDLRKLMLSGKLSELEQFLQLHRDMANAKYPSRTTGRSYFNTPLTQAILNEEKHPGVTELLLRFRADVNCRDTDSREGSNTPLHLAIRLHLRLVAQQLVEKGADVNAPELCQRVLDEEEGVEPLYSASNEGVQGRRPLHIAVDSGEESLVALLLAQQGIQVNGKDERGWTPLDHALMHLKYYVWTKEEGPKIMERIIMQLRAAGGVTTRAS